MPSKATVTLFQEDYQYLIINVMFFWWYQYDKQSSVYLNTRKHNYTLVKIEGICRRQIKCFFLTTFNFSLMKHKTLLLLCTYPVIPSFVYVYIYFWFPLWLFLEQDSLLWNIVLEVSGPFYSLITRNYATDFNMNFLEVSVLL